MTRKIAGPIGKISRRASAARLLFPAMASGLVLSLLLTGCGGGGKSGEKKTDSASTASAPAVSDTVAFKNASGTTDSTARMTALKDFLAQYPQSTFRGAAYSRLVDLMKKKSPDQVGSFLTTSLDAEKEPGARARIYYSLYSYDEDHAPDQIQPLLDRIMADGNVDPDVYNMVAWDLAEKGHYLDQAIRMAGMGVEKTADSLSKSSVLDTQGWAYLAKGDYPKAVECLEQANAYNANEEVQGHLATAYDKAGDTAKAIGMYKFLLYSQEDPDMRGRLNDLMKKSGGSVAKVTRDIEEHRRANSTPMQDLALKDYDGNVVHLAGLKGKVILLNFWHPT